MILKSIPKEKRTEINSARYASKRNKKMYIPKRQENLHHLIAVGSFVFDLNIKNIERIP